MTDPLSSASSPPGRRTAEDPSETRRGEESGGRHRPESSSLWWAEDPLYDQLYTDTPSPHAASVLLGDTAGHPLVPVTADPDLPVEAPAETTAEDPADQFAAQIATGVSLDSPSSKPATGSRHRRRAGESRRRHERARGETSEAGTGPPATDRSWRDSSLTDLFSPGSDGARPPVSQPSGEMPIVEVTAIEELVPPAPPQAESLVETTTESEPSSEPEPEPEPERESESESEDSTATSGQRLQRPLQDPLADVGKLSRATETTRPLPQRTQIRQKSPKHPALGLIGMICVGLVATFFCWVTAEPALLALGHSQKGMATVTHCAGGGLARRCLATFVQHDGRVIAEHVPLVGAEISARRIGASFNAQMVNDSGRAAYVTSGRGRNVCWLASLVCVLVSGVFLAWASGATRLGPRRVQWLACLASLAAPLVMLIGMIAISY